ncbi:transporter [Actinomyces sp. HMSC075C01]|uniref:Transporter n=2 Tax=Actinomyces TaxID=1654 RepID=A0A1Q8VQ39_9ACTO|nr:MULTISPECIES: transporter [Actinomyces]OFR54815.1 transporter [Actinomyces sp. HMSC075C01]OLO50210.1 transporter [Actinomyces oris]
MVATLVKLKWRLTLNALTKNVWAIIGTVFGALYGVGALAMVLAGAVGLGLKADADVIMLVLGALGALLVAGWAVVPLLITGLDSTLDPRAMAAWAAPSRGLALGLLAAGAVGIPGCITAAVCLIPVLTWLLAGQLAAALLALLCAPAALATCVLLSRIIVTAAGISSSRRGRETTAIIAFVAFMVCTQLPNLIPRLLGDDPTDILQPLGTLARVMGLSPFGWAFAAPGVMATGSVPAALALAIGAWILPVILLPLWQRVVNKAMTSPGTSHTRTRAYAADGAGSDVQHRGLPDVLPWARRLSAALPAPAAAVAARSLRYWRTDPRYLVQFVSVLILPVVLVLGPALNSSRFVVYVNGQRVETSFALGHAPTALLFMAPALAVFMGWALHDDLGMDSTALWSHLSAGISGAHDRLGRVVGAAVWQAPVMLVVDVFMVVWTGRWEALPAVTGACLALYGSALAWSCLASVLLPYETLAPGDSPMRSRTSGTAFLAALIQMAAILLLLAVCSPVLGAAIYGVVQAAPVWEWTALVAGIVWCSLLLWGGVVIGGRALDRRGPQVLATIRTWPGHAQPV